MEKSAITRDRHMTWSGGLLHGGSLMVDGCHVTSVTANSKAVGASREGQGATAIARGDRDVRKM